MQAGGRLGWLPVVVGRRGWLDGPCPAGLRRTLGERRAVRLAARLFGIELTRGAGVLTATLRSSLATAAGFAGPGCYFYSSLLGELLRVTSGFEGAMVHERCHAQGGDACAWRSVEAEGW